MGIETSLRKIVQVLMQKMNIGIYDVYKTKYKKQSCGERDGVSPSVVDAGRFQRLDGCVGEIADSREDSNTQYSKL